MSDTDGPQSRHDESARQWKVRQRERLRRRRVFTVQFPLLVLVGAVVGYVSGGVGPGIATLVLGACSTVSAAWVINRILRD